MQTTIYLATPRVDTTQALSPQPFGASLGLPSKEDLTSPIIRGRVTSVITPATLPVYWGENA